MSPPHPGSVLVAGIGNVFRGDDGFGVEVARRLQARSLPPGVRVKEFGTRGLDLAYALGDGYRTVLFVDIACRGQQPGTLTVLEPEFSFEDGVRPDAHGMDPVKVLAFARQLGATPGRTLVVACEPVSISCEQNPQSQDDLVVGLSAPVEAALEPAVQLIEELIQGELQWIRNES